MKKIKKNLVQLFKASSKVLTTKFSISKSCLGAILLQSLLFFCDIFLNVFLSIVFKAISYTITIHSFSKKKITKFFKHTF